MVTENQNNLLSQVEGQRKASSDIGRRRKKEDYKRKVDHNMIWDLKILEIARRLNIKCATVEEIGTFFRDEHGLSTKSDELTNLLAYMIKIGWVEREDHGIRTHIYSLTVTGLEANADANRIKASSPLRGLKTFSYLPGLT